MPWFPHWPYIHWLWLPVTAGLTFLAGLIACGLLSASSTENEVEEAIAQAHEVKTPYEKVHVHRFPGGAIIRLRTDLNQVPGLRLAALTGNRKPETANRS